jgi:hypothetical protein
MLLAAASYLGVYAVAWGLNSTNDYVVPLIVGGWNALLLIVTGLVIIDSVRKVRARRTRDLARDLFLVKLASIPFFLINFVVLTTIAFLGSSLLTLGAAYGDPTDFDYSAVGGLVAAAAIAIGLTYLAMLTTSTYGWPTISQLRRDGRIHPGLAVLYRVMLLVFVADVAAGILLYVHSGRGEASP